MKELLNRIVDGKFKNSTYTVYNKIEEDGYINELDWMFGVRYGVEDFEMYSFILSEKETNAIKNRMSSVLNRFYDLKKFLEKDIQEDPLKPKVKVYITKDKPSILVVKLKEFDVNQKIIDFLNNEKN